MKIKVKSDKRGNRIDDESCPYCKSKDTLWLENIKRTNPLDLNIPKVPYGSEQLFRCNSCNRIYKVLRLLDKYEKI